MNTGASKRSNMADQGSARKRVKTNGAAPGSGVIGKMSFAQKILMKQGWKEGQSLGKSGSEGIKEAIQVKLRPQGVGLGSVKEMTPQAKADARRRAEQRGEKLEESSDEDSSARRRKRDKAARTTPAAPRRQKEQFHFDALQVPEVPSVFKNLVDMTGPKPQLLASDDRSAAAGLSMISVQVSEAAKIAEAARRELEAFDHAWRELQDRRTYVEMQKQQVERETASLEAAALNMRGVADAVNSIEASINSQSAKEPGVAAVEALVQSLRDTRTKFGDDVDAAMFEELAVAAVHPTFKALMAEWQPLDDSGHYSSPAFLGPLKQLAEMLGINSRVPPSDDEGQNDEAAKSPPFESMMLSVWLPPMRALIVNEWDPCDAEPMLSLIEDWRAVLTPTIYNSVVNFSIVQRLAAAVKSWKPAAATRHGHGSRSSKPHEWLFPWLSYLDEYHLDARSSNGLLATLRRQLRSYFDRWDLSKGVMDGIDSWLRVPSLRSELRRDLETRMLPNLARHLRRMEINPADQDITHFENYLKWRGLFKPDKFARPLLDSFFPQLLATLHQWLISEPNYDEIGQWLEWWQSQIPAELNEVGAIGAKWDESLRMIGSALELGDRAAAELQRPAADRPSEAAPSAKNGTAIVDRRSTLKPAAEATEPKEKLEELCAQNDLLMLPTRKAHAKTGLPTYRVTASARGSGGVVVYIKGDIVWAQNKRDRSLWEPVDAFDEAVLTSLAESK